jgi:selenide, water dikinase
MVRKMKMEAINPQTHLQSILTRLQSSSGSDQVKLTQTVKKGGCAAKIPALTLREILSQVELPNRSDRLLVESESFDDAGVYQIRDDLALIETVDFFTPIVDNPHLFGQVAAANALSDVYAMGGRPLTSLAILAFPMATMENEVVAAVLSGAGETLAQAGALLVGGHSIDDDSIKFGLAVTGEVHPKRLWSNQGAQVGDRLILTKPLGTGTICAGLKAGLKVESAVDALASMSRLNNCVDFLSEQQLDGVHGATDITGFGLAGHSMQMALASKVAFNYTYASLPLFEQTLNCLEQKHLTRAHRGNQEYTQDKILLNETLSELERLVIFDPQTSGGLLLSVSEQQADSIVETLHPYFPGTAIVGEVVEPGQAWSVSVS